MAEDGRVLKRPRHEDSAAPQRRTSTEDLSMLVRELGERSAGKDGTDLGRLEQEGTTAAAGECCGNAHQLEDHQIEHVLYIRWFGTEAGQTKLNKLTLRPLENLDALKALPKELLESQYPEGQQLPDYFTNAAYLRFTPQQECLALPGDIVRTELRLALLYNGWEYTILKKDHQDGRGMGSDQQIHVMAAEFMGSDPFMAALGVRISLIAYPVVAVQQAFLADVHMRLRSSPDTFKGIL